ncbi:alcohol oxidase [Trametes meyenii]|nr:alcohol oxidase [Trametes meyenii]
MRAVAYLCCLLCTPLSAVWALKCVEEPCYDYVVVGGGTAGLVIAARLSEDPNTKRHLEFFGQAVGNPAFDWGFRSVPQPALNNQSILQARGKMLGGSSGLNFMAWNRASAKEYDAWEELGAIGWNWQSLLPYFKKSETISPPPPQGIFPDAVRVSETAFDAYHGRSGPMQPSYNVLYSNITAPYVETLNCLGIPTNSDAYNGNGTGAYNSELSIDRSKDIGRRSYSANTYYNISSGRRNLAVFLGTQATKILFDGASAPGSSLRARGVDVVALNANGLNGTLYVRKEVILSAGTIQTPQLLELSGIGNEAILKNLGIPTLVNLPGVGENLQDHPLVQQDFELIGDFWTYDELRNNKTFVSEQQKEYATRHTGVFAQVQSALAFPPLTSLASPDAVQTIRQHALALAISQNISELTRSQYIIQTNWLFDDRVADLEFIMYPGGGLTSIPPTPNTTYVTLNTGVMHPFARGSIHINSTDPLTPPVIDPKYMANAVDLASMLAGMKFVHKIAASPPLAGSVVGPHNPPANATDDAGLEAYLREFTSPFFHPSGTAAMVSRRLGGVVDPLSLKVYGTSNLRVVDASLLPLQVASHLQTAVYAIAERASDIIRGKPLL